MDLIARMVLDAALTPMQLLAIFVLGVARVLPLMLYVPFLGANLLPSQVKMGFSVCLVAFLLPKLLATSSDLPGFNFWLLVLALKEFFVGMIIGYVTSLPFQVVTTSGMLIDNQRGTGAMSIRDPTQGTQASPTGMLYNYVLISLYLTAGGMAAFLTALVDSYDLIAPDHFLPAVFFSMNAFWQIILSLFNRVMSLALQLAAPPFLAMLMTDLFLGIVNRLAPQVQIAFLGMSLKSLVAVTVLFFGWRLIMSTTLLETNNWLQGVTVLLQSLKT